MYYFKFEIPKQDPGVDDRVVAYSEGWFGTMNRCPRNVTVLLYNEVERFGIAMADDTFVPPEVQVISEAEALKLVGDSELSKEVLAAEVALSGVIGVDGMVDTTVEAPNIAKTVKGVPAGIYSKNTGLWDRPITAFEASRKLEESPLMKPLGVKDG